MSRPLAPALRRLIAHALRAPGARAPLIAAAHNVSAPTVRRIARLEGVALPVGRPTGDRSAQATDRSAQAIQLYLAGESVSAIAEFIGIGERSIRGYLASLPSVAEINHSD
jgi:transposase